jgi:hypothetical protein
VRLHFGGVDPVSAHTLAAAACEILRDVAKRKGVHHPYHNEVLPLVGPEKVPEFRRLIREDQNFLKHADRDPEGSMTLNPEFTECLLFEGARAHFALAGYETPETRVFAIWFCCKYPDVILDGPHKDAVTFPNARSTLDRPDLWLDAIDSLRAEHGDRLPAGTAPT